MLFPTIDFALFFLIVFPLAWSAALLARPAGRKLLLFAASLFFYGYWDWRFLGLLLLSANTAWAAGYFIHRAESDAAKRWIMRATVVFQLVILGFFKYWGFFTEELRDILADVGWERDFVFLEIILPVGISFFTFQSLSYVIDMRRGRLPRAAGILDLNLYISFFPQLVAGPIVRARTFLPQLERTPRLTRRAVAFGGLLVALGLFKKMVIAHYLAVEIVDPVFLSPDYYGAMWIGLGVYAYAIQIYCDFSGYSDIAIGIAALLGYRFKKNFDRPYTAASFQEFWRRWHISLSHWLRDYLYIELGGNRGGAWATYRNLMLTMLLGGLWHGAAWQFILWGAFHGAGLAVERALGLGMSAAREARSYAAWAWRRARRIAGVVVMFHLVCFGWVFFRAESLDEALLLLGELARLAPAQDPEFETPSATLLSMIFIPLALQWLKLRRATVLAVNAVAVAPAWSLGLALGAVLIAISALAPEGVAPFIYFQF